VAAGGWARKRNHRVVRREHPAEADEVFGVHGFGNVENGERGVRTHSECAAVFVLFVVSKKHQQKWLLASSDFA
jgi:hypothetical protein